MIRRIGSEWIHSGGFDLCVGTYYLFVSWPPKQKAATLL